MNKTLLLRKAGSQFIETITIEGKHPATRSYDNWEDLAVRLTHLGFLPEEIVNVKSEFDSGRDYIAFLMA